MYGMINQGIKDLIIKQSGEKTWETLCQEVGCPANYISMQSYDDSITIRLVGGASKVLGLPPEKILFEFGKYWINYTSQIGYGPIMDLFGSDFKSCLKNLNQLHTRMAMSMPQLQPPRFDFSEVNEHKFKIRYSSNRPGLDSLVDGLFAGLAEKFKIEIKTTVLARSELSKSTANNIIDFEIEVLKK